MTPESVLDNQHVRQAIAWWVRLREGHASPEVVAQCERWRAEHPDHERAWQRIHVLDNELGQGLRAVPSARQTLQAAQQALGRRRALQLMAAGVVAGTGLWANRGTGWVDDFATATGERKRFTLPGGAALTLNTHSSADVLPRGVRLKHGELLLESNEPIEVTCSLGTIALAQGRIALRDTERLAQLSVLRGEGRIAGQRVRPGQTLRASPTGLRTVAPLMDPAAWADGLIVTDGMPLGLFLDELGRYRRGVLNYATDVAGLMLSGVYRADDSDAVLRALTRTLPVRLSGLTRWWVSVERIS